MSFNFQNQKRKTGKAGNVTPISTSQRSTCTAVFYRWNDPEIAKINLLEGRNENLLKGVNDINGNLRVKENVVVVNDIVRCSITKNKSTNAGQFSITLKRGKQVRNGVILPVDIDYLQVLQPGDWVLIYMRKSGKADESSVSSNSGLKMMGIVENVRYVEVDEEGSGRPTLEYVVTGQDFGKVFDMNVFFNPLINQETASTILGANFLTNWTKSIKGSDRGIKALSGANRLSPDLVVKNLISFYLGSAQNGDQNLDSLNKTNEPWYIPTNMAKLFGFNSDGKSRKAPTFVDILDKGRIGLHVFSKVFGKTEENNSVFTGVTQLPGGTIFKGLPSNGTVWSFLQYFQNSAVNEMFVDLMRDSRGELRPTFVLRQVPFSNKAQQETNVFYQTANFNVALSDKTTAKLAKTFFTDLPQYVINSSDIKEKNVGKSDFERLNHILVVPKSDVIENLDVLYAAAANVPSIQRHGLKTFQAQTAYVFDTAFGNPAEACKYYLNFLIDWFMLNHQLYNGTIIIDGPDDHIELGSNLYISDIGHLYHIEGYNHVYEIVGDGVIKYTTTLTVSRGQVFKNNKSSFIGSSKTPKEPTTITTSVLEGVRNK